MPKKSLVGVKKLDGAKQPAGAKQSVKAKQSVAAKKSAGPKQSVGGKRKYNSPLDVTFVVGPTKVLVSVKRYNLREVPSKFKDIIDDDGGDHGPIDLPDEDLDVVELFANWVNEEEYSPVPKHIKKFNGDVDQMFDITLRTLCFAEKHAIVDLENIIFDYLSKFAHDRKEAPPSLVSVQMLYARTFAGSGIRRFLIDWYVFWADDEWYNTRDIQRDLMQMPKFAVQILVAKVRERCEKRQGYGYFPFQTKPGFSYSIHHRPYRTRMSEISSSRSPDSLVNYDHMPWAIDSPLRPPSSQCSSSLSPLSSEEEEEDGDIESSGAEDGDAEHGDEENEDEADDNEKIDEQDKMDTYDKTEGNSKPVTSSQPVTDSKSSTRSAKKPTATTTKSLPTEEQSNLAASIGQSNPDILRRSKRQKRT